ncbi:MAG: fused MFS/spermidine synthase [Alphaproteobacteria bacterium]
MTPRTRFRLVHLEGFVLGFLVMALELVAGRVLLPYFGSTIYQWGALITVVLACYATSYLVGGYLAHHERFRPYRGAIATAATLVPAAYLAALPSFFDAAMARAASLPLLAASLWGAVLLLAVPAFGLCLPNPILVDECARDARHLTSVGSYFSLATLGNIAGTLLVSFVLVPGIGIKKTWWIVVAVTLLAAMVMRLVFARGGEHDRRRTAASLLVLLPLAGWATALAARSSCPSLWCKDSLYQRIEVTEESLPGGGMAHLLHLDDSRPLRWAPGDRLVEGPSYTFVNRLAATTAIVGKPERVLILGIGGGGLHRVLGNFYPGAVRDGVEIDAGVLDAAVRFMGYRADPDADVRVTDARSYFRDSTRRWDAVFMDIFWAHALPSHLLTREFFHLVADHLSERGIFVLHVHSRMLALDDFAPRLTATLSTAFGSLFATGTPSGSIFLVATKRPIDAAGMERRLREGSALVESPLSEWATELHPEAIVPDPEAEPFTDDRNDADRYMVDYRRLRTYVPNAMTRFYE